MSDQKKQAELSRLVAEAMKALRMAESYADEHKLEFNWSPFYGGGGYYQGDPDERTDRWGDTSDAGWTSSSYGC